MLKTEPVVTKQSRIEILRLQGRYLPVLSSSPMHTLTRLKQPHQAHSIQHQACNRVVCFAVDLELSAVCIWLLLVNFDSTNKSAPRQSVLLLVMLFTVVVVVVVVAVVTVLLLFYCCCSCCWFCWCFSVFYYITISLKTEHRRRTVKRLASQTVLTADKGQETNNAWCILTRSKVIETIQGRYIGTNYQHKIVGRDIIVNRVMSLLDSPAIYIKGLPSSTCRQDRLYLGSPVKSWLTQPISTSSIEGIATSLQSRNWKGLSSSRIWVSWMYFWLRTDWTVHLAQITLNVSTRHNIALCVG